MTNVDFLKWFEECKGFSYTAYATYTRNSYACISQMSSLGPWIIDFGATDHIFGNKSLLSNIYASGYLLVVTLANDSKTHSQRVGAANPLVYLLVDSLLYVSSSPFNIPFVSRFTCSLDCVNTFNWDFVFLQNQRSRRIIGTGCESNGLYQLSTPCVCSVSNSPLTVHVQLGQLNLSKLQ